MQATRCDWFAEVFRLGVICFSEPATRADKQQRWLVKKVELYRRDLQRLHDDVERKIDKIRARQE